MSKLPSKRRPKRRNPIDALADAALDELDRLAAHVGSRLIREALKSVPAGSPVTAAVEELAAEMERTARGKGRRPSKRAKVRPAEPAAPAARVIQLKQGEDGIYR